MPEAFSYMERIALLEARYVQLERVLLAMVVAQESAADMYEAIVRDLRYLHERLDAADEAGTIKPAAVRH